MSNSELISKFYEAFANADSKTMVECYHENITFEDPAFGKLQGEKACKMWEMLLSRAKGDLKVIFSEISADEKTGKALWVATYNYGPKKRKVINHVSASFKFQDGKIIEHIDNFDAWRWSKQALGLPGYLLGWSTFMKNKIQKTTNGLLEKYMKT